MNSLSLLAGRSPLVSFDYQPRTRLVFGNNTLDRLGTLARELGGQRVLLVTDKGIVAAGHAERARQVLHAAGVKVTLFNGVHENPGTQDVAECVQAAQSGQVDLIVGLGGGSAMDTAKGGNFILTNGGRMQDYWGVGKATRPMLPLIAVPTTAGTGSECQSAALIIDERTHQKMACLDSKAAARVAILDPLLTLSQPPRVTALTGIDAIAHAVETAVTTPRTALSLMYSVEAFKLLGAGLPEVVRTPNEVEGRARMQLGAALAGLAIENSMLGAAHAAANPLTAHYGLVHGQAVGLMLPLVVRYNAQSDATANGYTALAAAAGLARPNDRGDEALRPLVSFVEWLLNLAQVPRSLVECNVDRAKVPALAEEAARQWTARFNPRPVTAADFMGLYEAAFEPRGDGMTALR